MTQLLTGQVLPSSMVLSVQVWNGESLLSKQGVPLSVSTLVLMVLPALLVPSS